MECLDFISRPVPKQKNSTTGSLTKKTHHYIKSPTYCSGIIEIQVTTVMKNESK